MRAAAALRHHHCLRHMRAAAALRHHHHCQHSHRHHCLSFSAGVRAAARVPTCRRIFALSAPAPLVHLIAALLLILALLRRSKTHQESRANTCLGMGTWQLPCPTSSIDSPDAETAGRCLSPADLGPSTTTDMVSLCVCGTVMPPHSSRVGGTTPERGSQPQCGDEAPANDTRSCARGAADPVPSPQERDVAAAVPKTGRPPGGVRPGFSQYACRYPSLSL
jgi:hypothetical protein